MSASLLTGAGLVVNMFGAASAFFFGFPQPENRGDALLLATSPPPEEIEHRRRRRRRLSYIGICLLLVGFGLQLAGVFVD